MELQSALSAAELELVSKRSNFKAMWLFVCNYTMTAGIFVVMALWPNPLTILVGIFLLGGRQLGFFVLVHECGHGTLFESKALNQFAGDWLAAALTFDDMWFYSRGHLKHHRLAGTRDDPDLINYQEYPITVTRLRRKIWRDLSGQTGWKQTRGLLRAITEFNRQVPQRRMALARGLMVNAIMLGLFISLGVAWLYVIWWVALFTSFRLVSRLRQVAEHANVPNLFASDPRLNTRTVEAPWYDRLLFCPLGVNYHLEHHMKASVPVYNLPVMHEILQNKGFYAGVNFPSSYREMLKYVTV
jgi:fatty acid desaturase